MKFIYKMSAFFLVLSLFSGCATTKKRGRKSSGSNAVIDAPGNYKSSRLGQLKHVFGG